MRHLLILGGIGILGAAAWIVTADTGALRRSECMVPGAVAAPTAAASRAIRSTARATL